MSTSWCPYFSSWYSKTCCSSIQKRIKTSHFSLVDHNSLSLKIVPVKMKINGFSHHVYPSLVSSHAPTDVVSLPLEVLISFTMTKRSHFAKIWPRFLFSALMLCVTSLMTDACIMGCFSWFVYHGDVHSYQMIIADQERNASLIRFLRGRQFYVAIQRKWGKENNAFPSFKSTVYRFRVQLRIF